MLNLIQNATVINPETGAADPGMDIFMENGKISEILPAGTRAAANNFNATAFDAAGMFAVPGLIDTHVHALGIYVEKSPGLGDMKWIRAQHDMNLEAFARSGVTTIRDLGGPLKMIQNLSERAEKKSLAPEVLYAGPVISVKGGYPYFVTKPPFFVELITGPVRYYVNSRSSARRAVDAIADEGIQTVKICFQTMKYDDKRTRIKFFAKAWMSEIIDRAHYHGLPVAVHHAYQSDLPLFIDQEFDTLEHIVCDGKLTEAEVEKIAAKNIPVCATFMTYAIVDFVDQYEAMLDKEGETRFQEKPLATIREALEGLRRGESVSKYFGRKIIHESSEMIRTNLALLHEAGVKIVHGTDSCGCITPPGCPHWEFSGMKRAGMSDAEILKTATVNAADAIGRRDLGNLAPGSAANVVLLRENPLDDIQNITKIAAVVRSGKVIHKN